MQKFVDETIYPPNVSAEGNNAFYHRCNVVEHEAPYASCLKHIADHAVGKLDSMFSTCGQAIGWKSCPAIAMREQEMLQGKAIYFVNRKKMREAMLAEGEQLELVRQKWEPPAKRSALTPRPAEPTIARDNRQPLKRSGVAASTGNMFADALNAAVSESKPVQSIKSPVIKPGMSPAQIARASKEQQ